MEEINLYDLIKYYAKKWQLIAGVTLLGLVAGVIYNSYIQTPLYKSEATLFLINPENQQRTQDATLINNYVELFESRRVLAPVIAAQDVDMTYEEVVAATEVSAEEETDVIKLSFASSDPQVSQTFLAGAVQSFQRQANNLYELNNVQVVDEASLSNQPYNVRSGLQLALAGAAAFMLAVIGLFFMYDFKASRAGAANGQSKPNVQKNARRKDESGSEVKIEPVLAPAQPAVHSAPHKTDSELEAELVQKLPQVLPTTHAPVSKPKKNKKKRSSRNHNSQKPKKNS